MLAMESDFHERPPAPEDQARVGLVDLRKGCHFTSIAETSAWNWQQGSMLQWLKSSGGHELVYNTRQDGQFASVVHNLRTRHSRTLPHPVYAVSADGRQAVTLSFSRLADCLPGAGYVGVPDPGAQDLAPAADGIWLMDLRTGESELTISLAQLVAHEHHRAMDNAKHWVNHLRFNPDGSRFAVLHQWSDQAGGPRHYRMLTAKPDGSDLQVVCDYELVTHYDWLDQERVLTWARQMDLGDRFYLFHVLSGRRDVVGYGTLEQDGHCSYSPDRRWILTDTYPDQESKRTLILYRPADDLRLELGRFAADPRAFGGHGCDLHPRWSRDGKRVCFDSVHEGSRQMYVMDVARIVA